MPNHMKNKEIKSLLPIKQALDRFLTDLANESPEDRKAIHAYRKKIRQGEIPDTEKSKYEVLMFLALLFVEAHPHLMTEKIRPYVIALIKDNKLNLANDFTFPVPSSGSKSPGTSA